jgi:hypothetical protein
MTKKINYRRKACKPANETKFRVFFSGRILQATVFSEPIFIPGLGIWKILPNFAGHNSTGVVAQMVEQRTENPCVTGSIPVDATSTNGKIVKWQDGKKLSCHFAFCGFM